MSLILAAMLAAAPSPPIQALPFIDRAALPTLVKYEAARDASARRPRTAFARHVVAERVRGLCGRAAKFAPPVDLLADVRQAYAMSAPKSSILAASCSALQNDVGKARGSILAAR